MGVFVPNQALLKNECSVVQCCLTLDPTLPICHCKYRNPIIYIICTTLKYDGGVCSCSKGRITVIQPNQVHKHRTNHQEEGPSLSPSCHVKCTSTLTACYVPPWDISSQTLAAYHRQTLRKASPQQIMLPLEMCDYVKGKTCLEFVLQVDWGWSAGRY